MSRYFLRSVFLCLAFSLLASLSLAQALTTTEVSNGYRFDHPSAWLITINEEAENMAYFRDGSMDGFILMIDTDLVRDNAQDNLEDVFDNIDRDDFNNGSFEEPYEEYEIANLWEVVRATRVRRSDRLLEYFVMATSAETTAFVRASLRRGEESSYLPQFDALIASVRHADAEQNNPDTSTSTAQLGVEFIGTEGNLLQIGALTANYVFADESYEFDYPAAWEIRATGDASLRFINREGASFFGTIEIIAGVEISPETALANYLVRENDYSPIESFRLNGYPAARAYRDNPRAGTKEIAMASRRADASITILTAAANSADFDALEPVFRAVLYSLRPNGSPLELSLVGSGARTALTSALVYGGIIASSPPNNQPQTAIPLTASYESRNGDYRLNYPADWSQDMEQNTLVLGNNADYELFAPDRGEVQLMVFFIDRIRNLDVDEFSPNSLLAYIIANDRNPDYWEDIQDFSSLGRRGAYADFVVPSVNWTMRTYFVELDAEELVYVRVDMVTRDNEIDDFEPYALAILETIAVN